MKKRFYKVNLEISNICNLQCSFCPEVIRDKKLMEVARFEKIIQQIAPLTEQVCFHLMGEPLLHPHLEELLEICAHHQLPVFFVSNGVLLTEKRANLLLHRTIRQVNFSLHSFLDNHPSRDPQPYLDKIFAFADRALRERPDLYLNFRLWNLQDALGQSHENEKIRAAVESHYGVQLVAEANVRVQKSQRIVGRLYAHYDTEFTWPSLDLPLVQTEGTCYGMQNHFGILADGTVVPCCLDKEGQIPLGHVDQSPIESILASEAAIKILRGFQTGKLIHPLCQRCDFVTRFNSKKVAETAS